MLIDRRYTDTLKHNNKLGQILSQKRFAVIGGDLRYVRIAELLKQYGVKTAVSAFGDRLTDKGIPAMPVCQAVKWADYIILPMPVISSKEKCINTPFVDDCISIQNILDNLDSTKTVFAGKIPQWLCDSIAKTGAKYCDYLKCEEMALANAVPTAEGAIQIAMEKTLTTIDGSRCLTIGYGRIGKALCQRLAALGADVTAAVRSESAFDNIKHDGYNGVHINDIGRVISDMDIIFNTVPALIINESLMKLINQDSLVIDLASKPGGVDFESASKFGFETVWALSLPGKVAPYTAGKIILNTIFSRIA